MCPLRGDKDTNSTMRADDVPKPVNNDGVKFLPPSIDEEEVSGLLDVKPRFQLQVRHQKENMKIYLFVGCLLADFWQKKI